MESSDDDSTGKSAARDIVASVIHANVRRALIGVETPSVRVGRYTVLDRCGSGAMGTVLTAYDPKLDRKVALKVLHLEKGQRPEDLMDEARSLAKLSHPNVVTVHDVGATSDQVYLAMEYIDGPNLRQWIEESRPQREILGVLRDVARGLAAVHARGTIHRDVKPDNILVGPRGAVLIDLGLATDHREARAGRAGTPVYFAPELKGGGLATSATDQFAFGITCIEALTGARPTTKPQDDGGDEAVKAPDPMFPDVKTGDRLWDRRVAEALRRSIASDPADRYKSMTQLVAALTPPPKPQRASGALYWAVGAALLMVIVVWRIKRDEASVCDNGTTLAAPIWGREQRAVLERGFAPYPKPLVDAVLGAIDKSMVAYRDAWAQEYTAACKASRVNKVQSDGLYDRRMACLERRRNEAGALLGVFETVSSPKELSRTAVAVSNLTPIGRCAEVGNGIGQPGLLPDHPKDAAAVTAARWELDRATVAFHLGRYEPAQREADRLYQQATDLEFLPLVAESLLLRARAGARLRKTDEALRDFHDVLSVSRRAGTQPVTARAAIELTRAQMFAGRCADVVITLPLVRAMVPVKSLEAAELAGVEAECRLASGELDQAATLVASALELETRPERAAILKTVEGSIWLARKDFRRAADSFRLAYDQAIETFGPGHPRTAFFLDRMARGHTALGDSKQALVYLERSLKLRRLSVGEADRAVATTLEGMGDAQAQLGQKQRATESYQQAQKIRTQVYPGAHPSLVRLGEKLKKLRPSL